MRSYFGGNQVSSLCVSNNSPPPTNTYKETIIPIKLVTLALQNKTLNHAIEHKCTADVQSHSEQLCYINNNVYLYLLIIINITIII